MGQFDALEIGLEVIRSLVEVMPGIKRQDADLERHIRRAASSVPMNLGEGNRRVGKDRLHFFRIAAGSADEVRTGPRGCFKSSPSDRGRARSSWARSEEARRELAQRRDTNGGYRRRRATQIHGLRSRPNPGEVLKQPLRSAEAWRYVDAGKIRHSLALIDRLLAVIWRLTN